MDSMCGLRLYPLERVTKLQTNHRLGRRMDFDIEIFVRLIWEGVPVFFVPVRVVYPRGNISNFDLIRDNWAITVMHTRLVLAMPLRLRSDSSKPAATDRRAESLGLSRRAGSILGTEYSGALLSGGGTLRMHGGGVPDCALFQSDQSGAAPHIARVSAPRISGKRHRLQSRLARHL